MKYRILSKTDKELFGANILVNVTFADLAALTSAAFSELLLAPYQGLNQNGASDAATTLAAGNKIQLIGMRLNTPFVVSDGGNTLTMTLGDSGNLSRYMASTQTLGTGAFVPFSAGTGTSFTLAAADNVILAISAQSGGHTTNATTAGSVNFYLRVDDITTWL